jgi:hypothetical protein
MKLLRATLWIYTTALRRSWECAAVLSRWLATIRPIAPIARTTMMVRDGNEVNVIPPYSINNVVGEALKDPFSESASERGTCFRVSGNSFRCLLYGRQEPEAKPFKSAS